MTSWGDGHQTAGRNILAKTTSIRWSGMQAACYVMCSSCQDHQPQQTHLPGMTTLQQGRGPHLFAQNPATLWLTLQLQTQSPDSQRNAELKCRTQQTPCLRLRPHAGHLGASRKTRAPNIFCPNANNGQKTAGSTPRHSDLISHHEHVCFRAVSDQPKQIHQENDHALPVTGTVPEHQTRASARSALSEPL